MKILCVDDEKLIVKGLKFALEQDGNDVDAAYDGEEALQMIRENNYDIILLDLMLPKMDGMEVCSKTREFSNVPIIMLTAKGEDTDKIMGLNCGADDYMTKPFNVLEVKARMNAVLRRAVPIPENNLVEGEGSDVLTGGDVRMIISGRRVFIKDVEYNLTAKEFEILALLINNPNVIFSREKLLNLVWGAEYPGDVRTVDVHIRRLREKIEQNPGEPAYVHTKWGVGYYFQN